MKLKLDAKGNAVLKDGKPVYVHTNGREEAFDAGAAMKILMGKHFETSPVMAGLKIPAEVACSFFGEHFRIEGGKLVALDKNGIQLYSPVRHGEVANFDEAFGLLVDRYESKAAILREPGSANNAPAGNQGKTGNTIARAAFDAMPPAERAKFISGGGRVGDDHAPAPTRPPVPPATQGGKTVTRAQFNAWPQTERMTHVRAGGQVVD